MLHEISKEDNSLSLRPLCFPELQIFVKMFCANLQSYNPRQKSWNACLLLQHLSGKFISSCPIPRFNVVYRAEFVIARFQHCLGGGGRGVPIPVMSLLTVSKIIASQRIFILFDSGVPRTFVVDCSIETPCLCTSAVHQYGGWKIL